MWDKAKVPLETAGFRENFGQGQSFFFWAHATICCPSGWTLVLLVTALELVMMSPCLTDCSCALLHLQLCLGPDEMLAIDVMIEIVIGKLKGSEVLWHRDCCRSPASERKRSRSVKCMQ